MSVALLRRTIGAVFLLALLAPPVLAETLRPGARQPQSATPASTSYQDIRWDDLIPKDWNPAASFKGMDWSRLSDNDSRAQEALAKMRAIWDNAPLERSLNGKNVRLPGFVIPLERQGELVSELLLVPYFGACIHSPPPPANQTVHVVLAKPARQVQSMATFWVSGTLSLSRGDSGLGVFGYRLNAASLTPYREGRGK